MKEFSKSFKLVVVGQIISLFGSSILRFALSLYVLEITGSATIFGTILAISIIPTIFISPVAGAIADRYNKRNLMVVFDLITSVAVAAFSIYLIAGNSSIIGIGVMMIFLSIISTMYQPTVQASIPVLVPKELLLKSNGIVTGVMSIANFLGPIIGGVVYSFAKIEVIVVASVACFMLSCVILLFVHIPHEKRIGDKNELKAIIQDMKDGLRYITHENKFIMKVIGFMFAINLFMAPIFFVGLPYIIKIMLKMPNTFFGFSQGAISISVVFSAMTIGLLKDKINRGNLQFWVYASVIIFGVMAFGASGIISNNFINYIICTICSVLVMYSLTVMGIFIMTLIQKETPKKILGKVVSIQAALSMISVPIGQIIIGFLIDNYNKDIYIIIIGVSILTLMLALISKRVFREAKTE